MCFRVFLFSFFMMVTSCIPRADPDVLENNVLRELVFLRTKGLLMSEMIHKHIKDVHAWEWNERMTKYYEITQSDFLKICKGKDLQLSQSQFDTLLHLVDRDFHGLSTMALLQSYEVHINASIDVYSRIIQEGKTDEISYFSFTALPGLLNLRQEINSFKNSNMAAVGN